MNPLTQFKNATILIALTLACFALSPQARGVCQEGCDTGNQSTFLGENALISNTGVGNTATGFDALLSNTSSHYNTAIGYQTLLGNTIGSFNTANGDQALQNNTAGNFNIANGVEALFSNTTGGNNTATGFNALFANMTGNNNIALGASAGSSLTTASNNIDIGNRDVSGESNIIRIGKSGTQNATFIAGISGVIVSGGVGVIVGSNGKLGTVVSSERFKDAVKPMDKASEAILALKPVTFRYKKELDPAGIPQFGLVAEQVEKVNPDLVARDEAGKPYSVRYEAVNAMLLNEFLKEHRKVEEQDRKIRVPEATIAQVKSTSAKQEAAIAELKSAAERQQNEIKALTASMKEQVLQIQKVSARLESNKPAPPLVAHN